MFIFEVFTGLWLSTPAFCIKDYDYVKRFVRVLVLLVINTACPKKLLKIRNTALLISSSNYAKAPNKCVHRMRFVFPAFSNFSETPCMKVGFDGGGVNGELFLESYFKASYFGELFLCKLDYL